MKNTIKIIKKLKNYDQQQVQEYIENTFGISYRAFYDQCKKGTMPYHRIKLLLKELDITFEELRGYQYIGIKTVKPYTPPPPPEEAAEDFVTPKILKDSLGL